MNTFELDNPLFGLGLLALLGIGGAAYAAYALNEANRETAQAQNETWNAQQRCFRSQTRNFQLLRINNALLQDRRRLLANTYSQHRRKHSVQFCTLEEAIASFTCQKGEGTL